jgi:F-type H+-transporting ATPase subunit b
MSIDWVTTIAQIVNFLILLVLLNRFLFKPVARTMDERETKINSRLAEAEETRARALNEQETYRRKNQELDRLREQKLSQLQMETDSLKKEWTRNARNEVEKLKVQWNEALRQDWARFLEDLRHRVCRETCAVTRNALKELADVDLDRHVLNVFTRRIRELPPEQRYAWAKSLEKTDSRITVVTAFEISDNDRTRLTALLNEQFSRKVHLDFKVSPEMVLGMELQGHDRKLTWNLDQYLGGLEEKIQQVLPGN